MAISKQSFSKSFIKKQEFSYNKNGTNLSFTLRVDNSSELKSFKVCLEEAIKDIEEILKGMKN